MFLNNLIIFEPFDIDAIWLIDQILLIKKKYTFQSNLNIPTPLDYVIGFFQKMT